jgi:HSP20 family protein
MKERKQTFLERLTGTHNIVDENGDAENSRFEKNPPLKSWSPKVDDTQELPHRESARIDHQYADPDATEELEDEVEEEEEAGLAIDMYESDNELVIQSMIAGVTPENLHIAITRDTVTIRGKRIAPQGIPDEHYLERELYWGVFSREIELPYEIDTDGAEAVEKYGLLIIRLPKLDQNRAQELKVKSI